MPIIVLFDRHPVAWLVLGALLFIFTVFQTPLAVLGWIVAVPLLRWVRLRPGWRGGLAVLGVLMLAGTVAVVRIATDPVPVAMAPMFGIPIALFCALPYLVVALVRLSPARRIAVFALIATLAELAQRNGTPMLSWGAAGYTQMDNLPLMQLASLGGLSAISLLVHGVGATLEGWLAGERIGRPAAIVGTALVVAHVWGGMRLHAWQSEGRDTVLVAAVDTPSNITGPDLPPLEVVQRWNHTLAERTRRAAAAGAELVVWTEAATLVRPEEVDGFQRFLSELAVETDVELVVGYVVPRAGDEFRYENTYAFVRSDGTLDHTYLKHEPVPGEPAVRGTEPARVVQTDVGIVGGAICYDYDAPSLGVNHARLGADIVAVPSSDWRGIDPVHTRMAAVRAIEGGHSVVRSTRWGLSAGIDPLGRIRGQRSSFDDERDGVLLTRVPRTGRWTLFGVLGEGGVAALLALMLVTTLGSGLYSRRRERDRSDHRGAGRAGSLRGARD